MVGTYRSESEAEWDVRIVLDRDGRGSILREDWVAGEDEVRREQVSMQWSCTGSRVRLTYRGMSDVLTFAPELSLSVMGLPNESAPGLVRQEPRPDNSLLWGTHFWMR
jgi:hypothetical protein